MNSKELLEQATAKIEKMNELMASLDFIEVTLSAATKPEAIITFFEPSLGAIGIRYILTDDVMESIKNTTLKEVQKVRDEKSAELEQLLGIQPVTEKRKPATINPEFEAATKDMFDSVKQSDPAEDSADDKSLDKYPAKKKSTFPEGMTEEVVRKMYIDQNMPQKTIAEHFGVKLSKVNTFIQKHNLFRGSYKKEGKSEPIKEHP